MFAEILERTPGARKQHGYVCSLCIIPIMASCAFSEGERHAIAYANHGELGRCHIHGFSGMESFGLDLDFDRYTRAPKTDSFGIVIDNIADMNGCFEADMLDRGCHPIKVCVASCFDESCLVDV